MRWLVAVAVVAAFVDYAQGHSCDPYNNNGGQHNHTEEEGYNNVTGHLTIPDGTTNISWSEYEECLSITGVTFNTDGSLLEIGENAFRDATNLAGTIHIPASVTKIDKHAFDDTAITGLTFESNSNLTEIGYQAFDSTTELAGSIVIPKSVQTMSGTSHFYKTGATSLTFEAGSNLESFPDFFLNYSPNLAVFEIPASVTSIGDFLGGYMPQLDRVIVPGSSNFTDATSLENLMVGLCFPSTGQACIDGNGTRAAAIINHADNTCNITCCNHSTCNVASETPTAPTSGAAENKNKDDDDDDGLSVGVIAGIAAGGAVFLGLVVYGARRHGKTRSAASSIGAPVHAPTASNTMSGGFKSLFEAKPWLQTGPHIKHVCAGILSLSRRNALSARKFTVAIMDASWVQNSFILALAVHLAKTKDGVTDRRMEWSISRYETMPPMDNGDIPTDFDLLHPSTALGALAAAAARLRDIPELSAVTDLLANSSEEQRQLLVEAALRGESKILPHQLPVGVDLK